MTAFRATLPDTPAVYVAQFSLIPLFAHHHDWDWRLESSLVRNAPFGTWTASKDGQQLRVCRDLRHWLLDLSDAQLYGNLKQCLNATGLPLVALFELGHDKFPADDEAVRVEGSR